MPSSTDHPAADPALAEILEALELPPHALRSWFRDVRAFCHRHGGERHYAELLALTDECLESLDCD